MATVRTILTGTIIKAARRTTIRLAVVAAEAASVVEVRLVAAVAEEAVAVSADAGEILADKCLINVLMIVAEGSRQRCLPPNSN